MGYSRYEKTVGYFVGYPDIQRKGLIPSVLHFAPNYLSLYVGSDGFSTGWSGKARSVTLRVGIGSFINPEKRTAEENFPGWFTLRLNNKFSWSIKEDDAALSFAPQELDEEGNQPPAFDISFDEEEFPDMNIEGINEYGWGLWTRWTMTYPKHLTDKSDMHTLVRMTTTKVY
jgi:hypothetical protein